MLSLHDIFTYGLLVLVISCHRCGALDDEDESNLNLVIHLIPHSHVDAGFRETSDACFEGTVSTILPKVLDQLDNDVHRRFVWAETFYFRKWYDELNQRDKERVRRVVKDGQLEFVGGGIVEHDEALTTWSSVVEQLALGHDWLEHNFGVKPRVGWQIDSSSHSDITPSLFAFMGYDSLILNRIHYGVKKQFKSRKHLEFIWRGEDLRSGAKTTDRWGGGDIFTHILYNDFKTPEGYDFESKAGVRQVTNAKRRADRLVHTLREWAGSYRTHHLLVPFGDRSRFIEADKQFTNMEKLMRHINEKIPDVRIRFSTASEYVKSVRETAAVTSLEFPRYVGDFTTYADGKDGYWTGVYSTRMSLKDSIRELEHLSHSTSIFFSLARARATTLGDAPRMKSITNGRVEADTHSPPPEWDGKLYDQLKKGRLVSGQMAHHHAITGTSSIQVVNDYVGKITQAELSLNTVLEASLSQFLTKRASAFKSTGPRIRPKLTPVPFDLSEEINNRENEKSQLQHPIIVYNVDGIRRLKTVEIYLGTNWNALRHVQIVDDKGEAVKAQLHHQLVGNGTVASEKNSKTGKGVRGTAKKAATSKIFLSFIADVPALGFVTYFCFTTSARERIKKSHLANVATPKARVFRMKKGGLIKLEKDDLRGLADGVEWVEKMEPSEKSLRIENSLLQIQVDASSGMLHSILDKRTKRNTLLGQRFFRYQSKTSGHFVFGTSKPEPVNTGTGVTVAITQGPVFEQIQVITSNGLGQTIRLWNSGLEIDGDTEAYNPQADLEGHVDLNLLVSSSVGADTVVRFETSMDTGGVFYTDNSLGRLIKRTSHEDAPMPSNVFPAVSVGALQDTQATVVTRLGQVLAIASKNPFGCSSPFSEAGTGTLELMLHRNHDHDDDKGVGESLNDFSINSFSAALVVGTPSSVLKRVGHAVNRVQRPARPFFAAETDEVAQILSRESWESRFNTRASLLKTSLPEHLVLESLSPRDATGDQLVLKLRNRAQHETIGVDPEALLDEHLAVSSTLTYSDPVKQFGTPFKASTSMSSAPLEYLTYMDASKASKEVTHPIALPPLTVKLLLVTVYALQDNQVPVSMYDKKTKDMPKSHNKVDITAPKQKVTPSSQEKTVERTETKAELEEKAEEYRTHMETMERRISMYTSNIDQLLEEVEKFDKQGKTSLKQATVQDLQNAEKSLEQATQALETSKVELGNVIRKIQTLDHNYKVEDTSFVFQDELRAREAEATVHGAVAGAAAMLLFMVAANWVFSGGLKLIRGYVPISVTFS
eukprot:CAMPEP_0203752564 /NCGR_PEP_ID=MMETSP0098-20131031/6475_1 /ASSEMBLY_ACC=CAM_ASM_000208 /TAXON_ID=96639 /ORGANISM=" , Strain NY0313808BC1" /LENGTH=1279 /DNA_ID=CAMNT_0050642793 /DNA_START=152 /DNA_END=3988 /DNA_ORIENTATION=-